MGFLTSLQPISDVMGLQCQKISMLQTTKLLLCVLKRGKRKGSGNLYFSGVAGMLQVKKQQPKGLGRSLEV